MDSNALRSRLTLYSGFLFVVLAFAVLVFGSSPVAPACDSACVALGQATMRAREKSAVDNARALDSARTALLKTQARTFNSGARYSKIRDSVFVPVSHTDTVEVLAKLPAFLAASDSLHNACTALAHDCDTFRVRAESSLAGLTVDRDLYKNLYASSKPSRWDGVKEWGIRAALVFGAFKLGQGVR